jgi:hypothetical protein
MTERHTHLEVFMSRSLRALMPLLLSCAGRPADTGTVNATLDGSVFVTGPVNGVVVSAYALDLDQGAEGALLAQSMPTDDSGAYHLDLGSYHGALLLVARGGGAYVEPATGVMVHWDATTELRAVFAARSSGADPRLGLETGEQGAIVISPWSDWAVAYAAARFKAKWNMTYADALAHALSRFRDHVEEDYWSVVPAPMASGPVGAWNDGVQAGVLLAGLSSLTARFATTSQLSPQGLSSLALVAAVRDDLSDAVLDGAGAHGAALLGTCGTACDLGPSTLRGDLRDAASAFLVSPANTSGITAADAAALLGRVAGRTSDLWPALTVPTVAVVSSSFVDDDGVTATVDGPGVGTASYVGQGKTVTLGAGTPASFVKFASRYAADAPNLPEWHFAVAGGRGDVTLRARLSRQNAEGKTVLLADWFPVPVVTPVAGAGFNRALVINSALHADVALVGGLYTLEFRAADALGNTTAVDCAHGVGCVTWTQTILPPPLRQRAGAESDPCAEATIPTGHVLGTGGPCPVFDNTASVNLNGPADRRIAEGAIDNPNPVPVQVVISATAPATIRRGLQFMNLRVGPPDARVTDCDETGVAPATPDGGCYHPRPGTDEYGTDDVLDRDLVTRVVVTGATLVGVDASGREVYELPPVSTATVWLESTPWRFLMSARPADYAAVGPAEFVTGVVGKDWLQCTHTARAPYGSGRLYCTEQVLMREFTELTRVTVQPQSSVTLTARPSGSAEASWATATGTNVAAFGYTDFPWDTKASGY